MPHIFAALLFGHPLARGLQDALQHLVVGKTVFIIAHRFSTIRDASMILVFDQGKIAASGTHASLYEDSPLYRTLYDRQHLPA